MNVNTVNVQAGVVFRFLSAPPIMWTVMSALYKAEIPEPLVMPVVMSCMETPPIPA